MSGSQALPEGKPQKFAQRKRTIFTDDQLEALSSMFNRSPYPDRNLKKEMASKMNMDPTVVQVWFKNHRAKLKKLNCSFQHIHAAQTHLIPRDEVMVKVNPTQTEVMEKTPPSSPAEFSLPAMPLMLRPLLSPPPTSTPPPPTRPLPTLPPPMPPPPTPRPPMPPPFRAPDAPHGAALVHTNGTSPSYQLRVCPQLEGHCQGHKVIHFGCCEDSSIYCLHPVSAPLDAFPSPLQPGREETRTGRNILESNLICPDTS